MPANIVDISLDSLYQVLGDFIADVLGLANDHVVQGFPNRVPMPVGPFVLMTNTNLKRLRTNVDTWDTADPAPITMQQEVGTQLEMQLDLYGPASGDWAVILTALLRDEAGCVALAPTVQPLYSDDPVRAPLTNAEEQYEDRWIVRAQLQYNPTVSTPQDFADTLAVDLINVDEAYPP